VYDQRGLPLQKKDGAGGLTNCVYDVRGTLISMTDPLGFRTDMISDELGRARSVTARKRTDGVPDAQDVSTSYAYDAMSRVTSIKAGNSPYSADRVTAFTYDPFGRRITTTYPDGAAINYSWSKTGRLTQKTDPRASVSNCPTTCTDHLVHVGIARGTSVTGQTFVIRRRLRPEDAHRERRLPAFSGPSIPSRRRKTRSSRRTATVSTSDLGDVRRFRPSGARLLSVRHACLAQVHGILRRASDVGRGVDNWPIR
jgi:YD repeat-containing protein